MENNEIIQKESKYAIFIVWFIFIVGIFSLLFLNVIFKIIGLIAIILSTILIIAIKFRRKGENDG